MSDHRDRITRRPGPDTEAGVRLTALLDENGARYRVIAHAPEGRTVEASRLRSHPPHAAAKCVVARLKSRGAEPRLVLVVVPGNQRVDFARLARVTGAERASFADRCSAERATGIPSGAITPIPLHPIDLYVDADLLREPDLYFNLASLDRSVALNTDDYLRMTRPTVAVLI